MIMNLLLGSTSYRDDIITDGNISVKMQMLDENRRPTVSDFGISLCDINGTVNVIGNTSRLSFVIDTPVTGVLAFSGYIDSEATARVADDYRYDITAISGEAKIIERLKAWSLSRVLYAVPEYIAIFGRQHIFNNARRMVGHLVRFSGCNWDETYVTLPNDWIFGGARADEGSLDGGEVSAYDVLNAVASAYNALWWIDKYDYFWMMPKQDLFTLQVAKGVKTLPEIEGTVRILDRDLGYDRVQLNWTGTGQYSTERSYNAVLPYYQRVKTHDIKLSYAPLHHVADDQKFYDLLMRTVVGLPDVYVNVDPFDAIELYPYDDPYEIESKGLREYECEYDMINSQLTAAAWDELLGGYGYIAAPTEAPAGKYFIRSADLDPQKEKLKIAALGYDI